MSFTVDEVILLDIKKTYGFDICNYCMKYVEGDLVVMNFQVTADFNGTPAETTLTCTFCENCVKKLFLPTFQLPVSDDEMEKNIKREFEEWVQNGTVIQESRGLIQYFKRFPYLLYAIRRAIGHIKLLIPDSELYLTFYYDFENSSFDEPHLIVRRPSYDDEINLLAIFDEVDKVTEEYRRKGVGDFLITTDFKKTNRR